MTYMVQEILNTGASIIVIISMTAGAPNFYPTRDLKLQYLLGTVQLNGARIQLSDLSNQLLLALAQTLVIYGFTGLVHKVR